MSDDDIEFVTEKPPEPEPEVYVEPPLSEGEITEIRWVLFGICPVCHSDIKDWNPGPFNPSRYQALQERGIDTLSGHLKTCNEKWRRH